MNTYFEHLPELTYETAALAKGMLARGDREIDVAVFLGVHPLVVWLIQSGDLKPDVPPAPGRVLPPAANYSEEIETAVALHQLRLAEERLRRRSAAARRSVH